MIKRLKECGKANKLFVEYYKANKWHYHIPLNDLLSDKYVRYQPGVFLDFIANMNIGILVTPKGFCLYIIDTSQLDEDTERAKDILFSVEENGWYNIAYVDIKIPPGLKKSNKMDAIIAYVRIEAIIEAMKHINAVEDLYIHKRKTMVK